MNNPKQFTQEQQNKIRLFQLAQYKMVNNDFKKRVANKVTAHDLDIIEKQLNAGVLDYRPSIRNKEMDDALWSDSDNEDFKKKDRLFARQSILGILSGIRGFESDDIKNRAFKLREEYAYTLHPIHDLTFQNVIGERRNNPTAKDVSDCMFDGNNSDNQALWSVLASKAFQVASPQEVGGLIKLLNNAQVLNNFSFENLPQKRQVIFVEQVLHAIKNIEDQQLIGKIVEIVDDISEERKQYLVQAILETGSRQLIKALYEAELFKDVLGDVSKIGMNNISPLQTVVIAEATNGQIKLQPLKDRFNFDMVKFDKSEDKFISSIQDKAHGNNGVTVYTLPQDLYGKKRGNSLLPSKVSNKEGRGNSLDQRQFRNAQEKLQELQKKALNSGAQQNYSFLD